MTDAFEIDDDYAPRRSGPTSEPRRLPNAEGAGFYEGGERNPVFGALVEGEDDMIGLMAYSLYKQNKVDFLNAFAERYGREPTSAERAAYIVGESTPRRLQTYRALASHYVDSTLRGPVPAAVRPRAAGAAAAAPDAASSAAAPRNWRETRRRLVLGAALLFIAVIALLVLRQAI